MSDSHVAGKNDPATEHCTYCPKLCRHACPVAAADTREALVTQQKMQALGELRVGRRPWTEDAAAPVYGCTGCGLCTRYCSHEIPVGETLLTARRELAAHGAAAPVTHNFAQRFAARDRALVSALRSRFTATDFAPRGAQGKVGFLPGCDSCASEDGLTDVERTLALFRALGLDARLVDLDPAAGPLCGGMPLASLGDDVALAELARRHAASLASYEVVVMSCPGCVGLMRTRFAALGAPLSARIVHLTEFLAPHTERLARQAGTGPGARVHYHDPCHLGRGLGVYEAPRKLLAAAGMETAEFAWSHADSQCSGGGGLLPITMPETSRAMARRRLGELEANPDNGDAPIRVVTACPTCKRSLGRAASGRTEVEDIASVLARALGVTT
ncbi:MAG: (Fe-S)-binding protein [Deltaproteobacteria bacterium]|nr:(Fe-S)-binding protein [Deltaproteobacteria bacterium]